MEEVTSIYLSISNSSLLKVIFVLTNNMPMSMPDVGDIRGVGLQVSKLEGAGDSKRGMMESISLGIYDHL